MTIGRIIKRYRKQNKISMDEFSAKSGLSKAYISLLEKEVNPRNNKPIVPTLDTIRNVAQAINMEMKEVILMLEVKEKIPSSNKNCIDHKKVFSNNLIYYMDLNNKTQNDIVMDLNINKSAISSWVKGTRLPRIDTIELLANYFKILKSDLIEYHKHTAINKFEDEFLLHMKNILTDFSIEEKEELQQFALFIKERRKKKT